MSRDHRCFGMAGANSESFAVSLKLFGKQADNRIKRNGLTKDIEMRGSESFIGSNFEKIRDLRTENFGVNRMIAPSSTGMDQKPVPFVMTKALHTSAGMEGQEPSEVQPVLPSTKASAPECPDERKAKRAPLRKYIRKVGTPGQERILVEVVEQKPKEITLASLKEKFGLSDAKIGGIIRDHERPGKMKRAMNGSALNRFFSDSTNP